MIVLAQVVKTLSAFLQRVTEYLCAIKTILPPDL
jgi:hypothetical protein